VIPGAIVISMCKGFEFILASDLGFISDDARPEGTPLSVGCHGMQHSMHWILFHSTHWISGRASLMPNLLMGYWKGNLQHTLKDQFG
jgi:hypothetical protein